MSRTPKPPDAPASVPAVVVTPRADWSDWSADRERQRLETEVQARQQIEGMGLYPREVAARAAADIAKTIVPDWRLVRQEHGTTFRQILREQPEVQLREVKTIGRLMTTIADCLPAHIQPLLRDARTIYDLQAVAREAAAFLIGVEVGRALQRQHVAPARPETSADAALRLHLDH